MNRYLIVTGASRGIGKSTAAYFLERDWQVINISRSLCDIAGTINFQIDLSLDNWIEHHREALINAIPKQTEICLLHNAAFYVSDSVATVTAENLRQALAVNILAPALLNQLFLPKMADKSSIVYIGSTLSEKAVPNAMSYVTSKHAVVGMMRANCQDLAGGIHTCCVCPGFVETEMLLQHLTDEHALQMARGRVKANRFVQPEEIASLVYYCATHPFVNGSVIHANLGQKET